MKLRKNIWNINSIILVVFLIASFSFVWAQEEESYLSMNEFYKDPTPDNFQRLDPVNQDIYVESINSFTNENDYRIAYDYFVNPLNVNHNRETFSRFMGHQGIKINIENGAGVKNYDQYGSLESKNGKVNLYQFMYSEIEFKVDAQGNLIIIDNSKKEWNFEGEIIRTIETQKIFLNQGSIGDKEIVNGIFEIKDGKLIGKAKEFGGISFGDIFVLPIFEFDPEQNLMTLTDADIQSVPLDSDISIYGKNVNLPNGDKINEGLVRYQNGRPVLVGSHSDVSISKFNHITSDKSLTLLYAESPELTKLDQEEKAELEKLLVDTLGKSSTLTIDKIKKIKQDQLKVSISLENSVSELTKERTRLRQELETMTDSKIQKEINSKIKSISNQINDLNKQIATEDEKLITITNNYGYFLTIQEEIQQDYQKKRNEIYQTLIPQIKSENENYFIYGTRRIWLGGDQFTSKVEDGNHIFPEFKTYNQDEQTLKSTQGQLFFSPQNGEMDIEKMSSDGRPMALKVLMEGAGQIINGKWEFSADGTQILYRTNPAYPQEGQNNGENKLVSSDMRFFYQTPDKTRIYDLNVDSNYYTLLSESKQAINNEKIKEYNSRIQELTSQLQQIENDPQRADELKNAKNMLETIENNLKEMTDKLIYQEGQMKRALQFPEENPNQQRQIVESIQKEINSLNSKMNNERQKIIDDPYISLYREIEINKNLLNQIIFVNSKQLNNEAFGEIISSENGDARLSYQEFIEGYPIIHSGDVKRYSKEKYDPSQGITVGVGFLEAPEIVIANNDYLNLNLINGNQECIDTQFRLAYEYALETGKDICFNDGGTCLRDRRFRCPGDIKRCNSQQDFIEEWMSEKGTGEYNKITKKIETFQKDLENKGKSSDEIKKAIERSVWTHDIGLVKDPNAVQPGDVILMNNHAMAVKEVIEIPPNSGKKYFRVFAGSQPAIDAHIYDTLWDVDELSRYTVYRWKFQGEGVETFPEDLVDVPESLTITEPSSD